MRLGSLCSGAGALDMAVEHLLGATTAWHCELETLTDKDGRVRRNTAVDVLAAHWPGVPNHGDLTAVDWDLVEPVDILTGGYPCQPFSAAGKRKGTGDERHIWPGVREAIRRLRPRITFLENVAGHRSLGFDRVLGDLAEDGLYARWISLRASDVGSCHGRERLWIIVTDPNDFAGNRQRSSARDGWPLVDGGTSSATARRGWQWDTSRSARDSPAANAESDGRHEGWAESAGIVRRPDAAERGHEDVDHLLPTPAASRSGRNQSPSPGAAIRPSLDLINDLLSTPSAADGGGGHLNRSGEWGGELLLPGVARASRDGSGGDDLVTAAVKAANAQQWGKYAAAIRRWEALTRPAPSPTEPNTKSNPRLNPAFSEWMMGWPAGWVTDVPGITRNDQLRIIGNGVVPQCAAIALRWLLETEEAA